MGNLSLSLSNHSQIMGTLSNHHEITIKYGRIIGTLSNRYCTIIASWVTYQIIIATEDHPHYHRHHHHHHHRYHNEANVIE